MKTWKDETIKRELNRLAEGLQEVDKTIISYVRISMGNLSDTRTVTVYTDFANDEWLFKVTFNFEINTMTVECGRLEPYTKKISSLKSSVNYCLESFNTSFDEFESYYGVPYKHYLSTTKTEDVAEETTDEPTPEEADREVTYIDFKPEQDYEEERPPHAAFEQLRRDSIEPPKIWSCKALKVQEILQKIYEGKTKTSGERLDAYYNHCNNLILASRIFLPECMYRYLERKLSNELVIAGVCPAVIEEAFGYKKTRRKWYWKL